MTNIVIVFHSQNGHTKKIAEAVFQGAAQIPSTNCFLVEITMGGLIPWDIFHNAHAIVFGSPTYMGNVSAPFKSFMDQSGDFWLESHWKDKIAAGFTIATSPSGDKSATLVALMTFAMQHGMIWVGQSELGSIHTKDGLGINEPGSWLGLMASSNPDKSRLIFEGDKRTAVIFWQTSCNHCGELFRCISYHQNNRPPLGTAVVGCSKTTSLPLSGRAKVRTSERS